MGGQIAFFLCGTIVDRVGQAPSAKHPCGSQALLETFGPPRKAPSPRQHRPPDPIGRLPVGRRALSAGIFEPLSQVPKGTQADRQAGGKDRCACLGEQRRRGGASVVAREGGRPNHPS